ncbi:MAG TPA: metallophosphoesterase [Candidatus Baltobacteraceae bacterium]|nr:metallophosphoesterase [Candidatus Baltobacteraceae bacterium]
MHLLFAALLLRHWLLATDLHVEPGRGRALPAAYARDTNWALLDSTVAQMRKADPAPQVVVLSGDFLAHHFARSVPLAERTMARIARTFDAAFPHAQFVIVPGNNDDPCGDYRATPGSAYFRYFAHLWAPLVDRNGAAPDFERSFGEYGWYTARLPGGLRAIALDSVYWSVVYRRCANYHPDAPQRELRWFAQSLEGLPRGTRALVVMHIPPGVDPHSTLITHRLLIVPFLSEDVSREITRIFSEHAQAIGFVIAGHTHRDDFRLFGGVPMLLAPSVSPVYENNPAFLRLDLASGGVLQDYRPFFYDEWSGRWRAGQSFDQTFGVKAFSAADLATIHARLAADPELRARWARMFMSQSGDRDINSGTWRTYWCAQNELAAGFVGCAGLGRRVELLPVAAGAAAALVLAGLALLAVRLGRARTRS